MKQIAKNVLNTEHKKRWALGAIVALLTTVVTSGSELAGTYLARRGDEQVLMVDHAQWLVEASQRDAQAARGRLEGIWALRDSLEDELDVALDKQHDCQWRARRLAGEKEAIEQITDDLRLRLQRALGSQKVEPAPPNPNRK